MTEQPPQTFLFADLAGYTALTEVHGDEEAVRLIDDYGNEVRALLSTFDAHEVKSIGDALLVRVPRADAAVRLGLRTTSEIGSRHGFPAVRVGMHHGPAIERDGDYFGRTVNIAARVAALATGGEVLVTEETAKAAGRMEAVRFIGHGRYALKGIDKPLAVYAASADGGESDEGLAVDPVCHMVLDPERAAGTLRHAGAQFHFCSLECIRRFAESPDRFR